MDSLVSRPSSRQVDSQENTSAEKRIPEKTAVPETTRRRRPREEEEDPEKKKKALEEEAAVH